MVNIYGRHFIYDGKRSSIYDLILANVETNHLVKISGDKEGNFVFNRALKCNHLIGDDYTNSPLSFEIDIVTCSGRALTYHEVREIKKWLFDDSVFRKLYIDPVDDPFGETRELVNGVQKSLYFNARFLSAEKLEYSGGVVGFRCTLETDSMMMWQDACSLSFDFTEAVYYDIPGGDSIRLLRGDVTLDGKLMPVDAMFVLEAYGLIAQGYTAQQAFSSLFHDEDPTITNYRVSVADMDGDGVIKPTDAMMVLITYANDQAGYPVETSQIVISDTGQVIELEEDTPVVTVYVDSDIDGYTYPTITIFMDAVGGDLKITNYNDDANRYTEFSGLGGGAKLVIDSSISRVGLPTLTGSIDISSDTSLYSKMTTKNFPRLVNGENQIVFDGNVARVEISWNNRRTL